MHCRTCGEENRPETAACSRCAAPLDAHPLGGRYRLERFLGKGGYKYVYLAVDLRLERPVAVAVLQPEAGGGAQIARIETEARAMARVAEHPNVVTVFDAGKDGGRSFLVSEYLAGGDLRAVLASAPRRRLPVRRALAVAADIARALEFVHGQGLVHGDVQPANVWLTAGGIAKLGDFGLATGPGHAGGAAPPAGTALYLAPERALGATADARADLYALGAVLYEALTGRAPFVASDAGAVLAAHVNTPPRPPSEREPAVPAAVDDLVGRLLAKRPDDRPASAAAVRQALEGLLADERVANPLATTAEWPAPAARPLAAAHRRTRRRRAAVALGVLGAILAVPLLMPPHVETPAPAGAPAVIVGVMRFAADGAGPEVEWTRRVLRDGLNAILSRVDEVRVYAKEVIDFRREKHGLAEIEVARDLGIEKMISGTIAVSDAGTAVELHVVDIATGYLEASITRQRPRSELVELQNDVATALLDALGVPLAPERRDRLFARRRGETIESYERFYESLGELETPATGVPPERDSLLVPPPWRFAVAGVAHAQEGISADEAAIRAVLEAYRQALEAEDVDGLASLHLEMTARHREGLARYFAGTRDLRVRLFAITVEIAGDEALVSYTREDAFIDERSGRPVLLDTRLSRLLAKWDGVWKIGNRKDPS